MKKQHCISQQHFSIYTICFGNNLIYTVLLVEVEIHTHTPLKCKINERKKDETRKRWIIRNSYFCVCRKIPIILLFSCVVYCTRKNKFWILSCANYVKKKIRIKNFYTPQLNINLIKRTTKRVSGKLKCLRKYKKSDFDF